MPSAMADHRTMGGRIALLSTAAGALVLAALGLVADGLTNKEIGAQLRLAEKTVKNYVSTILSKLEVARRAEAAAYLARHTGTPGAEG